MKKAIVILLSFLLAVSSFSAAYAENAKESTYELQNAKYVNLFNVSASLDISGNTAYCTGFAKSVFSTDTIKMTMYLQKQTSTGWSTVAIWYKQDTRLVTLDKSKSGLSAGTYRIRIYVTVYNSNGNFVESANAYSKLKTVF